MQDWENPACALYAVRVDGAPATAGAAARRARRGVQARWPGSWRTRSRPACSGGASPPGTWRPRRRGCRGTSSRRARPGSRRSHGHTACTRRRTWRRWCCRPRPPCSSCTWGPRGRARRGLARALGAQCAAPDCTLGHGARARRARGAALLQDHRLGLPTRRRPPLTGCAARRPRPPSRSQHVRAGSRETASRCGWRPAGAPGCAARRPRPPSRSQHVRAMPKPKTCAVREKAL